MYSSMPQQIFGFHGCDREIGMRLINGDTQLFPSNNSYDWLGHGIYFWEQSYARAMDWAIECSKNPKMTKGKITTPFVVGAIIDLGRCLNLTDQNYFELLSETYKVLKESHDRAGLMLPKNIGNSKKLDCAVINSAIQNSSTEKISFDTVRGAFIEGKSIYPGSTLCKQTHIQVCVRNPNCIKGYFNPLKEDKKYRLP